MQEETQERDLSIRSSGLLSGENLPRPRHPHHWTRDEYEEFLWNNHYPSNTIDDRLRMHRQLVIEALYKGKWVPEVVLQDYPDAQSEADDRRMADAAFREMDQRDAEKVARFQARYSVDEIAEAIMAAHPAVYGDIPERGIAFELDGEPYYAEWRSGRYQSSLMADEQPFFLVRQGQYPTGIARRALMKVPEYLVYNKQATIYASEHPLEEMSRKTLDPAEDAPAVG